MIIIVYTEGLPGLLDEVVEAHLHDFIEQLHPFIPNIRLLRRFSSRVLIRRLRGIFLRSLFVKGTAFIPLCHLNLS